MTSQSHSFSGLSKLFAGLGLLNWTLKGYRAPSAIEQSGLCN